MLRVMRWVWRASVTGMWGVVHARVRAWVRPRVRAVHVGWTCMTRVVLRRGVRVAVRRVVRRGEMVRCGSVVDRSMRRRNVMRVRMVWVLRARVLLMMRRSLMLLWMVCGMEVHMLLMHRRMVLLLLLLLRRLLCMVRWWMMRIRWSSAVATT
jgi:hypothetical protein